MLVGGAALLFLGLLGVGLWPLGTAFFTLPTLNKCRQEDADKIEQFQLQNGKLANTTATAADRWTFVGAMTSGFIPKIIDCLMYVLHPEGGNASTGYAQFAIFGKRLPFNLTFHITEKDSILYVKETNSRITPVFYGGKVFLLHCCNEDENANSGPASYQIDVSEGYDQSDYEKAQIIARQLGATELDEFGVKCKKYLTNKDDKVDIANELVQGAKRLIEKLLGFK